MAKCAIGVSCALRPRIGAFLLGSDPVSGQTGRASGNHCAVCAGSTPDLIAHDRRPSERKLRLSFVAIKSGAAAIGTDAVSKAEPDARQSDLIGGPRITPLLHHIPYDRPRYRL